MDYTYLFSALIRLRCYQINGLVQDCYCVSSGVTTVLYYAIKWFIRYYQVFFHSLYALGFNIKMILQWWEYYYYLVNNVMTEYFCIEAKCPFFPNASQVYHWHVKSRYNIWFLISLISLEILYSHNTDIIIASHCWLIMKKCPKSFEIFTQSA